jgi:hypothetical protein
MLLYHSEITHKFLRDDRYFVACFVADSMPTCSGARATLDIRMTKTQTSIEHQIRTYPRSTL